MHILIYNPFHPVLFLLEIAHLWTLCSKLQVIDSELHYVLKIWNKDVTEYNFCGDLCCPSSLQLISSATDSSIINLAAPESE